MTEGKPLLLYQFKLPSMASRVSRLERGEAYTRRGELVLPSGRFTRAPFGSVVDGRISTQYIRPQGNLASRVVEGLFTYTATDTSVTLYWDGSNSSIRFVLRRMDGTVFVVPGGSLTISALSHSTQYDLIPFWPLTGCNIGWVPGETGTPRIAHTEVTATELALAAREDRERLVESTVTIATNTGGDTATGPPSTGGSFSGGGAGGGYGSRDGGHRGLNLE